MFLNAKIIEKTNKLTTSDDIISLTSNGVMGSKTEPSDNLISMRVNMVTDSGHVVYEYR